MSLLVSGVSVLLLLGTCRASSLMGIIQKSVVVHFQHIIGGWPLLCMVQLTSDILTLHPALHSLMTDTNDRFARPGRICANRAFFGSCGRSNLHV